METGHIFFFARKCWPPAGMLRILGFLVVMSAFHAEVCDCVCVQVNCYSLNNVGPTMERLSGPKRFLAIYFTSAIASNSS